MVAALRILLVGLVAVLAVRRASTSRSTDKPMRRRNKATIVAERRRLHSDNSTPSVKGWMRPAAWFIAPIAAPAWLAESIVRRRRGKFWEFDMWSGTFYLLGIVAAGLVLLASRTMMLRFLGLYVLTAVELLGLLVVGALPAGQFAGYASSLKAAARRRAASAPAYTERTAIAQPLWAALTAYLYTTVYFAICGRLAFEVNHQAFAGISRGGHVMMLFEFYYTTFVSMVTLGYVPNVTPTVPVTQVLYMIQFAVSLGFLVLVFSVVVDRLVNRSH
jgi:hypothetical protein